MYCKSVTATFSVGDTNITYDPAGYNEAYHSPDEAVVLLDKDDDLGTATSMNDTYLVSTYGEGWMELTSGLNREFSAASTVCIVSHWGTAFCPDPSATFCTILFRDAKAGETSLVGYDHLGFAVGDNILISDDASSEAHTVVSIGSLNLEAPLANDYAMISSVVSKLDGGVLLRVASEDSATAQASTVVVLMVLGTCAGAVACLGALVALCRKRQDKERKDENGEMEEQAQEEGPKKATAVEEAPALAAVVPEVVEPQAVESLPALEYDWMKPSYGRRADVIEVNWNTVKMHAVEPPPMSDAAYDNSDSDSDPAKDDHIDLEGQRRAPRAWYMDPKHASLPRNMGDNDYIAWDVDGQPQVQLQLRDCPRRAAAPYRISPKDIVWDVEQEIPTGALEYGPRHSTLSAGACCV